MQPRSPLPVRVGVFNHLHEADLAVDRLVDAGFDKQHITVICPTCSVDKFSDVHREEPAGVHTPAAAAGGGAIGALLGGLVALAGVTATGGLSLLAVGPLLLGAGGGAVAGGFIGAMLTRGMEDQAANFYDQALQKGQILVAVESSTPDSEARLDRADHIFAELGSEHLALPKG
jgi:hypothetical protein